MGRSIVAAHKCYIEEQKLMQSIPLHRSRCINPAPGYRSAASLSPWQPEQTMTQRYWEALGVPLYDDLTARQSSSTYCSLPLIGNDQALTQKEPRVLYNFYHHLDIQASKVKNLMKNTCPNDIFTSPQKEKELFFVLKVVCPQYIFSMPDSGNCCFLVFQNTCPNLTFTCPGQSGKVLM